MRTLVIPSTVQTFKEGSVSSEVKKFKGMMDYRPQKDERIDVRYWHRWPSYDFIFGVPHHTNRYYGKEVAYFVYRDVRRKKVKAGFYVDMTELKILARGFVELMRIATLRSKQR